jgi:RloB-like protein
MRKNRSYKRGEPFRDALLFIFACEGAVREKQYFEALGKGSQRLKIIVIEHDDNSKSAPKWVIDRLVRFLDLHDKNVEDDDQIWLVLDTDRWKRTELQDLLNYAQDAFWRVALSNPCFEVWLHLHVSETTFPVETKCKQLKTALDGSMIGGYSIEKFIPLVDIVINRAEALYASEEDPLTKAQVTKVFELTRAIRERF